jgi:hypothetical protein
MVMGFITTMPPKWLPIMVIYTKDPLFEDYLFLPLVWPHGIIGHLGETFGSFTASTAPTLEFLSTKSRL